MTAIVIIFGLIIIALLVYIILKSQKAGASSRGTSLNDVLQNAYPNLSYDKVFELGVLNAFDLLSSFPCYTRNDIDTYAFFYRLGELSVMATGGKIGEYKNTVKSYLSSKLTEEEMKLLWQRQEFYWRISYGEKVEGLWALNDIPDSILSVPMLRCAVAFGDCITNPDMIEDYYGAPLLLYGIDQKLAFQQRFTNDFFRLVHTYCVMVAGREFDPPILNEHAR